LAAYSVDIPAKKLKSFSIGAGVSRFLGVRRILAGIFANLPEKLFCDFCLQIFSMFLEWPPKKGFHLIFWKRWPSFFKSNNVGRHFRPDLRQIKSFGGVLAPHASYTSELFYRDLRKKRFSACTGDSQSWRYKPWF